MNAKSETRQQFDARLDGPAPGGKSTRRGGHTLVELMVSMLAATVLMTGLASSIFIASRAFDGNSRALQQANAAEVQADMMIDLTQATSFSVRDPDSVTFTVPDRDGDSNEETITYAWSGLPTAQLSFAQNGNPPVTILDNVQDFSFAYLDRFMTGGAPPLPPLDPSQWGSTWQSDFNFGYESVFPSNGFEERQQIATRVTLTQNGILQSLSAYFTLVTPGGKSDVRLAIYGVNQNNNPENLLASTAVVEVNASGWVTLSTAPVALTPGEYYLALSIKKTDDVAYNFESGAGETHINNRDAVKNNFTNPFGNSTEYTRKVSMYGSYSVE